MKQLTALFIITVLLIPPGHIRAQVSLHPEDNALLTEALDSLASFYFFKKPPAEDTSSYIRGEVPVFSDSIYAHRIKSLNSAVPFTYNDQVKAMIHLYGERRRDQVSRMLGMKEIYFPVIEAGLDRYNLPMILKYLPVIESALNTHAVSKRGATGLWQFMYSTGRLYGLKIDTYVDERRDPYLATDAACRFLTDMYSIYRDWLLVIAAYNSGPGNVNKAIRRSGGLTGFWQISEYLPRETRGYVPAFIAASYIMNFHEEHHIYPSYPLIDLSMIDTVHVTSKTTIQKVARYTGVPPADIAFLNPALKTDVIPAFSGPYPLSLPLSKIAAFDQYADSIYYEVPLPDSPLIVVAETAPRIHPSNPAQPAEYNPQQGQELLIYTVKSGDNLGYIAEWYDIKSQDIRDFNRMYGSSIKVGQKLQIYLPADKAPKYSHIESMTFEQKQAIEAKQNGISAAASPQPVKGYLYHTVREGDTLWDIANKYPGNTIEGLRKLNSIANGRSLKPGMVIKVSSGS